MNSYSSSSVTYEGMLKIAREFEAKRAKDDRTLFRFLGTLNEFKRVLDSRGVQSGYVDPKYITSPHISYVANAIFGLRVQEEIDGVYIGTDIAIRTFFSQDATDETRREFEVKNLG